MRRGGRRRRIHAGRPCRGLRAGCGGLGGVEGFVGKVDVFVSYGFANPWGHTFDRWGQDFVADASGGANYFAAAFSGDVDYPRKHPPMQQFLVKQWRPTSGCELVSSRNFPDELQGNYLLNNVIEEMGGEIQDIVISELREHTYFAKLRVRHEGELLEVDCRPSDAIALAVTARVPIYVAEDVLNEVCEE